MTHNRIVWMSRATIFLSISVLTYAAPPAAEPIPADAKYACPMDFHPAQENPREQGAYFSEKPGDCPWCGMKLKPLDELAWVKARRAAEGAEVAFTCTDHPQFFSKSEGECPRCKQSLEPFKVMYTCPDPAHASFIQLHAGNCPRDNKKLVPFRGMWLSEKMAAQNTPTQQQVAHTASYHCTVHPLVRSASPGNCTICAAALVSAYADRGAPAKTIPADMTHVCPMAQCDYFAAEAGRCPVCGMKIRPIEAVKWARALPRAPLPENTTATSDDYACPMHPQERAKIAQRCTICGMQLVKASELPQPKNASEAVQVQMNHLMEHYLELQQRFAADRATGAAQQALGLIAAADELEKLLEKPAVRLPAEFRTALKTLREASVKMRRENLATDRVAFVELSAALRTMIELARPASEKYDKIFIFHCPMSKGDWLQTSADMKNPYYGFEMLKCGELVDTR